ncbi:MAG TPA: GDSL-type esterase/lipase family protein, partial [Candidatus Thermoplasmatota archaeon]|nr:GDSL-type esterase/lipase family protein [Candidatus Thermoplasmatota archaeon]
SGAAPGEHPEVSWATGNASLAVSTSHAARLRAMGADALVVVNAARSGAPMADFARQAALAVEARAEYVTVLLGANDVCRGRVSDMTGVEDYRASFREGAQRLRDGLPRGAVVLVASVPDVAALAETLADDPRAQTAWRAFRACPVLLSTASTPEDREAVRARVAAYAEVLEEEARAFGFAYDGGAVHGTRLLASDVSDLDYFHPSFSGQARLANATWAASPLAEAAS